MDTHLDVFVPIEPSKDLSPNGHRHWTYRADATQQARAAAKYATVDAMTTSGKLLPKDYGVKVEASIHWPKGRRRMDGDNALAVLKPYIDGIADALEINDRTFVFPGPIEQHSAAAAPGVVFCLSTLAPGV